MPEGPPYDNSWCQISARGQGLSLHRQNMQVRLFTISYVPAIRPSSIAERWVRLVKKARVLIHGWVADDEMIDRLVRPTDTR
jgi:hypothetical protein